MKMSLQYPNKDAFVPLITSAVILLITLVTFSEVLQADFVMWDDDIIILGNQKLARDSIGWIFTDVDTMMRYNPLTFLSWTIIYRLAGFDPRWFHFANWLLHGLSAVLLYLSLREILQIAAVKGSLFCISSFTREFSSLSGALLWALHPLRVEPVAWATDLSYCQAMFFLLGTLLFYLKAHQAINRERYCLFIGLSLLCYSLSLLSYCFGITFFIVLFIIDIFLFRRVTFSRSAGVWKDFKTVVLEKLIFALPALMTSIVAVIIRYSENPIWETPVPLAKFGVVDRTMQAFYILSYYLWKTLYPIKLAPIYTTLISFNPYAPPFLLGVALIVGVSIVCILFRKRWPFLLGLWLCYLLLELPFAGFFEHPHFPSDRYSLISSLCFSLGATVLIVRISQKLNSWPAVAASTAMLVLLGGLTFQQVRVWHNSETLFKQIIHTLGDDPYRVQILGRLGTYYQQMGQTEKAIAAFHKLLDIKPDSNKANSQLASIYSSAGQFAAALPYYQKIISLDPNNAQNHYDLGIALTRLNRMAEAAQQFQRAETLKNR